MKRDMGQSIKTSARTIALAALLFVTGCSTDPGIGGGKTVASGDPVSVTLSLAVPDAAPASRAALSADQTSAVKTVDVFVFDAAGKLADWKYGTLTASGSTPEFTARLKSSTGPGDTYRLMVLANSRHLTYPVFGDSSSDEKENPGGKTLGGHKGETYAQIYALLKAALPSNETDQTAALAAGGIPMWGMFETAQLIDIDHRSFPTLPLVRSLAMINVGTNPSGPQQAAGGEAIYASIPNFSLEGVYFYNGNSSYSLTPLEANYDYTDQGVDAHSLPASVAKFAGPTIYSDGVTRDVPAAGVHSAGKGYGMAGSIFAAEAEVDMLGTYGDANHKNRPCIVVKGYYSPDGKDFESKAPSYYRIDIRPGGSFKDLLRNNAYQVTIESVSGAGKPTPEEAFESVNADLTVVILTWNISAQGQTVVDGQNRLHVDRRDIETDKWPKIGEQIVVTTNVAAGWKAEVTDGDWLSLNGATNYVVSGASGDALGFDIEAMPASSDPTDERTGKIEITAGAMSLSVVVHQTNTDSEFMVRISSASFSFPGRVWNETTDTWEAPAPKTLNVNWAPRVYDYEMTLEPYVGGGIKGFTPAGSTNNPIVSVNPSIIKPTDAAVVADHFHRRSSILTIVGWNADRSVSISKQAIVDQTFYALDVTGMEDYYFQNKSYSLSVNCNAPWKVEVLNGDNADIFVDAPNLSVAAPTVDKLYTTTTISFTIDRNATAGTVARLRFYNPDHLFPDQIIEIPAEDELPNSFMVETGGTLDISVRKAYRTWRYDHDLKTELTSLAGQRSAELVWQDAPNLISSMVYNEVDGGEEDYISVTTTPGVTGNAVIAFKIGAETYWSWCVWVTDYDPETENITWFNGRTIMDRNLGSITSVPGNGAIGNYYQMHRKDPFPRMNTYAGRVFNAYDENGTPIAHNGYGIEDIVMTQPGNNLKNVVQNPHTFYTSNYGSLTWYGQEELMRAGMWGREERIAPNSDTGTGDILFKGEYDPCPAGWHIITTQTLYSMDTRTPASSTTVPNTGGMLYWDYTGYGDYGTFVFPGTLNNFPNSGRWSVNCLYPVASVQGTGSGYSIVSGKLISSSVGYGSPQSLNVRCQKEIQR